MNARTRSGLAHAPGVGFEEAPNVWFGGLFAPRQRMPCKPSRGIRQLLAVKRKVARKRHESRLGPERQDEVVMGKADASVALTIFAAREKPWTDFQVIEYKGDFYEAVGKRLVERGGHHAYRYEFRHLEHGDIIRGPLVRYPPEAPSAPDTQARRGGEGTSGKVGR